MNQFTVIEGRNNKRSDVVVFVNGLLLVMIELKNSTDEAAGITEAFYQLQTYKSAIPSLFNYNIFLVTSEDINGRAESLTVNEECFMMWRTTDGKTIAPTSAPQLEVLLRGMFQKNVLLDILRHFIVFQTDGEHAYKIVAAYEQYYAVNKAVEHAKRATAEMVTVRLV